MAPRPFEITPVGPFDLARSIQFLEQWPASVAEATTRRTLEYATTTEHDGRPIAVAVAPSAAGVRVHTSRAADAPTRRQITRALSLDVDATDFGAVGRRDPVIARLQAQRPGLRPVCFWSVWEAAVWAVLAQRSSTRQAAAVKDRLARELGTTLTIDDTTHAAFPSPQDLLDAPTLPGVPAIKAARLHGLARAALDGVLTGDRLRASSAEEAMASLLALDGIGPFSAALITIRGAGHPDVFSSAEPRLVARMRAGWGEHADLEQVAAPWAPFRSWCSFLVRSATDEEFAAATEAAAT